MIEFPPGTVHDVAHLRPFDLALALQGHPLTTKWGESVRLFRCVAEGRYAFDYWHFRSGRWHQMNEEATSDCDDRLRLAPLAAKDGRGLHVGDQIEVFHKDWFRWAKVAMNLDNPELLTANGDWQWRWPESKASAG